MPERDLAQRNSRTGFIGTGLLREEEVEIGVLGRSGNPWRRPGQGPIAGPELELGLGARISHGSS